MNPLRLFQPGRNPWRNGLRLALLNGTLAAFCIGSFLGVLWIVSWLNQLRLAIYGPSSELPFPYPVLLLLYAVLCLIAWVWFARRLPNARRARIITALVGSVPFFGLSLLGYVGVIGALIFHALDPGAIPAGSFYVFGAIATLILFAAMTCVALISLAPAK